MKNQTYLILITIVSALGGLLFGYDTGVINGSQYYFSQYFDLDPGMKGWVVGSALIGCFVGAAYLYWRSSSLPTNIFLKLRVKPWKN